ncbi:hypothetical protein M5K25_014975 [Dendrobium thyrsiflorum]|uniref:Uncharacterized protein n=1 Tax=Dendrobium thyrsiflorum TaxID=117978 RepID=A0ABD0UP67_DENTH
MPNAVRSSMKMRHITSCSVLLDTAARYCSVPDDMAAPDSPLDGKLCPVSAQNNFSKERVIMVSLLRIHLWVRDKRKIRVRRQFQRYDSNRTGRSGMAKSFTEYEISFVPVRMDEHVHFIELFVHFCPSSAHDSLPSQGRVRKDVERFSAVTRRVRKDGDWYSAITREGQKERGTLPSLGKIKSHKDVGTSLAAHLLLRIWLLIRRLQPGYPPSDGSIANRGLHPSPPYPTPVKSVVRGPEVNARFVNRMMDLEKRARWAGGCPVQVKSTIPWKRRAVGDGSRRLTVSLGMNRQREKEKRQHKSSPAALTALILESDWERSRLIHGRK